MLVLHIILRIGEATSKIAKPTSNYHIAGKFGGLAVYITTTKLKSAKISYSHKIHMAILY